MVSQPAALARLVGVGRARRAGRPAPRRRVAAVGRRAWFVTWDGGGNVGPVLALGARLRAAGWDVAACGPPSLAARFAADGVAYDVRDTPDPWDVTVMARDVLAACARAAPDVAVVDYMLPGALCGTEAAGCPTAAFVHTLYGALLDGGAPGPMAMAAGPADVAAARHALGLGPVDGFAGLLSRCGRLLVTSAAELDRPPDPLPPNVRYVGPLFEDAGPDAGWAPPPGDAPMVVVSLGTTPMGEGPVLARLLEGLAREDMRVVATVGAHLVPWGGPAPANAVVTGYVRHAAVLPHASLVVCHGGLGTIAAALAHGLPVLCLPLGRDQPDNAVAVERAGAGTFLPPDATPAELALAAVSLLDAPRYAEAASHLARSQSHPPADAVTELTSLAASG